MTEIGKLLVLLGGILVVLGLLLLVGGRFHFPFGRLPGDIVYHGRHTTVYFPIITCLVLSLLASLLLYLWGRLSR
jgi:hypothetical protein